MNSLNKHGMQKGHHLLAQNLILPELIYHLAMDEAKKCCNSEEAVKLHIKPVTDLTCRN